MMCAAKFNMVIHRIVILLIFLIAPVSVGAQSCLFPDNKETATFQECDLTKIPDNVRDLNNAQTMIFRGNNLTYINPLIFFDLPKLRSVDFSFNLQLVIKNDSCFLNSSYITTLDIQGINTLGVLRPKVFECCPFEIINMTGPNCPQTKILVEAKLQGTKVICTDADEDLNRDWPSTPKVNSPGTDSTSASTTVTWILVFIILISFMGVIFFLCFTSDSSRSEAHTSSRLI